MFDLVRALNSSIDAGELTTSDEPGVRATFERFDKVLGVLALRRHEDERPPVPVEEIEAMIAAPQGGATGARTSPRPTASARTSTPAASCSRTPARSRGGRVSRNNGFYRFYTVLRVLHGSTLNAPEIKTTLPGPKARAIIDRDRRFVSPSYTRDYPFVIARGEGAVVEDVDGNRFLDCAAGIAVNSTGVSHPDVVAAIVAQAQQFLHMSGTDFYYEPQVRLAEELASIVPIDGRRQDLLRQLRHGSDGGGDQAGALSHEAARASSRSSAPSMAVPWVPSR